MWAQRDIDGYQYQLLDASIDHKSSEDAIQQADGFVVVNGCKHMRKNTKEGWQLCVKWKDGSTSWERLADIKESNPIVVAEYAVVGAIDKEPAYAWWVNYTLKKIDRIISAIKQRVVK